MSHCLRFNSEQEAIDAMPDYRRNGQWITDTASYSLCIIGVIVVGNETEPTALDGWHMNYLGDLPESLLHYKEFPVTPKFVFAV